MAQFDVYSVGRLKVVDLQSDLISLDYSRIVAPLRDEGRYQTLPRLTPRVFFEGSDYIVHTHDLAAIPGRQLGVAIGSLSDYRDDLLRAIDILTRGF